MSLTIILAVVFLSVSLVAYSILFSGARAVESQSSELINHADSQLKKMFLFADARRLLALYLLVLIVVPVTLWFSGVSPVIVLFGVILLLILPRVVLKKMELKRREAVNKALPDALAQIAGAMRAGSTFTTALQSVVDEQKGPLGQEFGLMLREQRIGARLEDALDNLGERVQSEELDLVISATMISQEVGGNLGEILQSLSETIRRKTEMEGKIKALTAQGVLQGIVVTLLPFMILGVLLVTEPKATSTIFTTLLGWIFLGIIIVMEVIGGLVIKKIVSIDI